jgi:hypothetical protein
MQSRFDYQTSDDVRPWIIAAINDESGYWSEMLWPREPNKCQAYAERLRRIKCLRKHIHYSPAIKIIADRLSSCEHGERCLSGACTECHKLFQRWCVRHSDGVIDGNQNKELVAITIIPSDPLVRPGELHNFSVANMHRRIKYALLKAEVDVAIGGVDYSFNEHADEKYPPHWCPHVHLIAATENKKRLRAALRESFSHNDSVPYPICIKSFDNSAYGWSYIWKSACIRRVGYYEQSDKGGDQENSNTRGDKLRVKERLELFLHLDQVGLASRIMLYGAKPVVISSGLKGPKVRIEPM